MNILKTSSLSIDYNENLRRINISSGQNEFVSLTHLSWKLLLSIMQFVSEFEHVEVQRFMRREPYFNKERDNQSDHKHDSE